MLFACLATQLFGQVSISKETQSYISHNKGKYILQNLTIVDGTGNQPKYNQDIVINGDIIEAIGKDLPIPKNTTVINMGCTTNFPFQRKICNL